MDKIFIIICRQSFRFKYKCSKLYLLHLCYGLYAAQRFDLQDVHRECYTRLQNVLNDDYTNALQVLQLHERFNTCEI